MDDRLDNQRDSDLESKSMKPFWLGDTMLHESLLMVSCAGELPIGKLLFHPIEVLSVKNARLDQEYAEGADWEVNQGQIRLTKQTRIPYMMDEEMNVIQFIPGQSFPRKGGAGATIYREESFFHDRQIVVTYRHASEVWLGPVPQVEVIRLPRTIEKLRNGKAFKLVLYGDSISDGSNASGFSGVPPYLPVWGGLVAGELARRCGSDITFTNCSVGGTTSLWGKEEARERVAKLQPDLVIIAFGMNDGSGTGIGDGVSPDVFQSNILSIIDTVRSSKPEAEFILVGTTLPNEDTICLDKQPFYYDKLNELTHQLGGGAATADMTGVHRTLLNTKSFADMTGNNVNHPNDFLSRWHAQFIVGMLTETTVI